MVEKGFGIGTKLKTNFRFSKCKKGSGWGGLGLLYAAFSRYLDKRRTTHPGAPLSEGVLRTSGNRTGPGFLKRNFQHSAEFQNYVVD